MHCSVSVIIPCFRCAETIERAIGSVLAQTYLPQEIILIDDFSNDEDRTFRILEKIRDSSPSTPILVIKLEQNGGPGTARNAGWEKATGEYIAFLDSDDSWHTKKLEIQYQWMSAHPEVVLSGHQSVVKAESESDVVLPTILEWHQVPDWALLIKNAFPTRSVMLKRELPNRFFPGKRYAEDYLLWLTVALTGHQTWSLNAPLAFSYKEEFGAGGLTGHLWRAEQGVMDTYRQLRKKNLISPLVWAMVCGFSALKFVRRWTLVKLRGLSG